MIAGVGDQRWVVILTDLKNMADSHEQRIRKRMITVVVGKRRNTTPWFSVVGEKTARTATVNCTNRKLHRTATANRTNRDRTAVLTYFQVVLYANFWYWPKILNIQFNTSITQTMLHINLAVIHQNLSQTFRRWCITVRFMCNKSEISLAVKSSRNRSPEIDIPAIFNYLTRILHFRRGFPGTCNKIGPISDGFQSTVQPSLGKVILSQKGCRPR